MYILPVCTETANSDGGGWGVRLRECVCGRARIHACVHDVFAIFYNNILPRLIMIKISFLYFIEIAHTDDFPSTGTRLVLNKLI